MATPATFTTLGALHDLPSNDEILDRIKSLARNFLPEGWRNWQLINSIDLDFQVDPSILNKLRFLLPTEGIAKAFDPSAAALKEHPFRDMKVKMLSWAFCRGLVFSPSTLSKQIRGSSQNHDVMGPAVTALKPSLLSREAADRVLSGTSAEPSVRRSSTESSVRMEVLEARTQRVENSLTEILTELRKKNDEEVSSYSLSDSEAEESSSPEDWIAPALWNEEEDVVVEPDLHSFSFDPCTKELEPIVPLPSSEMESLGLSCHRFGSAGWSKIPFLEAQKEIHAGGVFSRLKVPEIDCRPSAEAELLANMDGTFGVLSHGLLLRR
uniref:Uncharacterized protein n=1 Tax=Cacopsylla melanoneura TaxID=428564 RepID=A0A8D8VLA6_9HEMI